ncbi:DUF2982 domain-containing protein [Vibrio mediterranei]|uniref:DUF2982 domain-containing protein n=1 Tax=Vibrio mediterranei TaxID=689 RepID=A0A3G4V670_9VIBR|nr:MULTISPECIES: DUF2982 domain-containing protein [Vibrio]AYV20273.1 DUF2982 domain-containing protein [Vibrio mediterranei]EDL51510.1 hypothetical protein VSAK1_04615 [Vibrio mediterranei AK1]MCG9662005.1 DUF2982 domain-containing protein [Vibrio mediterranei]MDA0109248.1 DUF2982 domain-containing protein [Vibrio sp. La 4.2.2]NUW72930.1 DUF2982 domain-containing protein [Vibrio mediterranei]
MDTLHFSNHNYTWQSPTIKVVAAVGGLACFSFLLLSPNWQQALVFITLVAAVMTFAYFMLIKSRVTFTLTATHFQQHVFKGGWVVKWSNIERIGVCTHHQEGWHKPLPWIGIRLKHYQPYLDAICPRVATDLLLSQRALLYLGAQQTSPALNFEDIVLDSEAYVTNEGKEYRGLLAMLANRMRYQREFYGFDVFVAEADLDRSADEFVGLTRRYLAAADRELS